MSYFIFDMDETLAELYSVYYFIASLRLQETLQEHLGLNVDNKTQKSLEKAYDIFLEKIVEEETSITPLGILRPGIVDVMRQLKRQKQKGVVRSVLIYSNNSHLESLEFIRDLIYLVLDLRPGDKFISECVHYNHPMRSLEKNTMPFGTKSWNTLKDILINGNCGAPNTLEADHVVFFDDLAHPDLAYNLGPNYYRVPAYTFKASFDRIADIFINSLIEAGVDLGIFSEYLIGVFMPTRNIVSSDGLVKLKEVIAVFKERTRGTVEFDILPPEADDGIQMMMDAIKRVGGIHGGKRRLFSTRKKNKKRRIMLCLRKN